MHYQEGNPLEDSLPNYFDSLLTCSYSIKYFLYKRPNGSAPDVSGCGADNYHNAPNRRSPITVTSEVCFCTFHLPCLTYPFTRHALSFGGRPINIISITLRVIINAPLICIALRAIAFPGLRLSTSRACLPRCFVAGSAWLGRNLNPSKNNQNYKYLITDDKLINWYNVAVIL